MDLMDLHCIYFAQLETEEVSELKRCFCTCRFSKTSLFQRSLSKVILLLVFLKTKIVSHLPWKRFWKVEGDEKEDAFVSSFN